MRLTLGKETKLCSLTAIGLLFNSGESRGALAFPLRAVWRPSQRRDASDRRDKFMITVPKKKLRHAVDRVRMRRLIREAYRLNRHRYAGAVSDELPLDIAFVYVDKQLHSYAEVEQAMCRLLGKIYHVAKPE